MTFSNSSSPSSSVATPSPPLGIAVDPCHADNDPDAPGNFLDNYDLDWCEGGGDYTLSEKMVHYCGGVILAEHWAACKAVLAFHAGVATSKLNSMTKVVKEAACLTLYKASVAALDPLNFCDASRAFFLRSFRKKDEPVSAEHLYRYYLDSRLKMRNHIIPFFPKDLVTMKSGKGFHESCNDVYTKAYRQEMTKATHRGSPRYTALQVEGMYPPPMWEYTKMPWFLGLAVKIFRRDPQLAPNVADVLGDVANLPVSRAELKRRKQVENQLAYAASQKRRQKENTPPTAAEGVFSTPSSAIDDFNSRLVRRVDAGSVQHASRTVASVLTTTTTKNAAIEKKILWAKVLTSKSIAENTNIAKRMGKMEELEKAMALLDKMRNSIGEVAYHAQVQDVLNAFPLFHTYHAEVDVIEIIDDDDVNVFNPPVDENADSTSGNEPNLSDVVLAPAGCQRPPQIILLNLTSDVDIDNNSADVVNETNNEEI